MGHKKQKPTRAPYMYSDPTTGQPRIASPNHNLPDRHFKPENPAIASTLPVPPTYPFKPRCGVFKPILDPESADIVRKMHESRERLKKRQLAKKTAEAAEKAKEKLRLEDPEEYEKQRAEEEQAKMRKAYRRVDIVKAKIPGERPSRRVQEKKAKEAQPLQPARGMRKQATPKPRRAAKKKGGTVGDKLAHAGDDILPSAEDPVEPVRRPEPSIDITIEQWLHNWERQEPKRPSSISMITVNQTHDEEEQASAIMDNHNSTMRAGVGEESAADHMASVIRATHAPVQEQPSESQSTEDADKLLTQPTTEADAGSSQTNKAVVLDSSKGDTIGSDHQYSHLGHLSLDAVKRYKLMRDDRFEHKWLAKLLAIKAKEYVEAKAAKNLSKDAVRLRESMMSRHAIHKQKAKTLAREAQLYVEAKTKTLEDKAKTVEGFIIDLPASDSGGKLPPNTSRKRKSVQPHDVGTQLSSDDGDDDVIYVKTTEPCAANKRVKLIVTAEDEYIDTRTFNSKASTKGDLKGTDDVIFVKSVSLNDNNNKEPGDLPNDENKDPGLSHGKAFGTHSEIGVEEGEAVEEKVCTEILTDDVLEANAAQEPAHRRGLPKFR